VTAEDLAVTLKDVLSSARATNPKPGATGAAPVLAPIAGTIEGEVRMTADKVSNALVVTGSAADLDAVRELVARLDMPRRQVYVEAAVLDLNADLLRQVGISLHRGIDADGAAGVVSSSSSTVNSLMVDPKAVAAAMTGGGLLAGVLGPSFNVAGMSIPSFGVVLQALETTTDSSVLSRPHLMMLDHMKATISVGQMVPFPATGTQTLTGVTTTFNREKVALKMDLTPHLSDDQEIRLEIDGEISDLLDGASTQGGPITNQRIIKTTVIVQDGETIVLGGLQKEEASDRVEKVPVLGDIPVLGRLFQTRRKIRKKQDLLIVLTPYIIRDATDLRRVYERKEADRRELIQRTSLFSNASAYDPHVDYKRKRGLLEEINRCARLAEEEGIAIQSARAQIGRRRPLVPGEVRVPEVPPTDRP
jgi:general secretion pathway protein D